MPGGATKKSKPSAAILLLRFCCCRNRTPCAPCIPHRIICSSLNSTLRTTSARPHVSDTDWYPSRGILSVIAIYQQLGSRTEPNRNLLTWSSRQL